MEDPVFLDLLTLAPATPQTRGADLEADETSDVEKISMAHSRTMPVALIKDGRNCLTVSSQSADGCTQKDCGKIPSMEDKDNYQLLPMGNTAHTVHLPEENSLVISPVAFIQTSSGIFCDKTKFPVSAVECSIPPLPDGMLSGSEDQLLEAVTHCKSSNELTVKIPGTISVSSNLLTDNCSLSLPTTSSENQTINSEERNVTSLSIPQDANVVYHIRSGSSSESLVTKHRMDDILLNPYMCAICGEVFGSIFTQRSHLADKHQLELNENVSCQYNESSEKDGNGAISMQKHFLGDTPEALQFPKDKTPVLQPKGIFPEPNVPVHTARCGLHRKKTCKEKGVRKRKHKSGKKKKDKELILFPEKIHWADGDDNKSKSEVTDTGPSSTSPTAVAKSPCENAMPAEKPTTAKVFKCEFCEEHFSSNKYRYKHRVTSHPLSLFECPGCDKSFKVTDKDKWQHHIRIHNKPPPKPKPEYYTCNVCCLVFRTAGSMAIHKQNLHPEHDLDPKPFCCEVCGKMFRNKRALKSHQSLVHSDKLPFTCKECGRGFKKKAYLKLHARTHTGEKPFPCQFCEKTFPSSGGRRTHEKSHTNERPYKCLFCDMTFKVKTQRVEHERTHTNEKPFICRICNKSYASRNSFKTHQFLHTGQKPYRCGRCPRAFAQKTNLNYHFRSVHTQERPYHCTVCELKFSRSTSRKLHMEKKHGLKITVRQGRPPFFQTTPEYIDLDHAACLSMGVPSGLIGSEVSVGNTFSVPLDNLTVT